MAIAFQSSNQTTGTGSTTTLSLTISSGDVIVVGVSVRTTELAPTISAAWNTSESLTASPSSVLDGGAIVTSLLYITSPTSGTHDIDITLSLAREHGAIALVYSGVDSVDTGSEQTTTTQGSTSSVTVTSASGNLVVDVLGVRDPTSSVAVTGSATERGTSQEFQGGESSISMSDLAGAASTVMSWGTWTGSTQLAHIGLELVEAAGGGGSNFGSRPLLLSGVGA